MYEYYAEGDYKEYQIPPNWVIARMHGKSKEVGPVVSGGQPNAVCPCCGWQVERRPLAYCCNLEELDFLGSAFHSYYVWLKYAIAALLIFFALVGVHAVIQNHRGTTCTNQLNYEAAKGVADDQLYTKHFSTCNSDILRQFSLFNKQAGGLSFSLVEFALVVGFVVVSSLVFLFLRVTLRQIDVDCDSNNTTPADYTMIVKNIPLKQNANYDKELEYIFTNCSVPGKVLNVKKIVLVFDSSYVHRMEEKLASVVADKQKFLERKGFKDKDPEYVDLTHEIENHEKRIRLVQQLVRHNEELFTGTAFITVNSEREKQLILTNNPWSYWQWITCYFNGGRLTKISSKDLTWDDQKLFIEEAPEPHDVDWNNIQFNCIDKIPRNLLCWLGVVLIGGCVLAFEWLWLLCQQFFLKKAIKSAQQGDNYQIYDILQYAFIVVLGLLVALINWVALDKLVACMASKLRNCTKSEFHMNHAQKLATLAFFNSSIALLICYFWISDITPYKMGNFACPLRLPAPLFA